jgi:signal transduction histidine kinase
LRTPLNSIIGFTGIVLQGLAGPLNEEQAKQLGMVRGSARHLLDLINDVLDLSKIEAGQLEIRSAPFDLRESVERVIASVQPQADLQGIALKVEFRSEIGTIVNDRRRVEQVLINLVNNGIKFTDQGSVLVIVEPADGGVTLRVRDTGIGIREEDLRLLFQPFRQVDIGISRVHDGTGLGLAICRRLAALRGGESSVMSDWGEGSEFSVTLPTRKIEPA